MVLNNISDTGILTVLIHFNSNVKEFLKIIINSRIFNLIYIVTFIWWIIRKNINPTGFEITSVSILVALIIQFCFKGE